MRPPSPRVCVRRFPRYAVSWPTCFSHAHAHVSFILFALPPPARTATPQHLLLNDIARVVLVSATEYGELKGDGGVLGSISMCAREKSAVSYPSYVAACASRERASRQALAMSATTSGHLFGGSTDATPVRHHRQQEKRGTRISTRPHTCAHVCGRCLQDQRPPCAWRWAQGWRGDMASMTPEAARGRRAGLQVSKHVFVLKAF